MNQNDLSTSRHKKLVELLAKALSRYMELQKRPHKMLELSSDNSAQKAPNRLETEGHKSVTDHTG